MSAVWLIVVRLATFFTVSMKSLVSSSLVLVVNPVMTCQSVVPSTQPMILQEADSLRCWLVLQTFTSHIVFNMFQFFSPSAWYYCYYYYYGNCQYFALRFPRASKLGEWVSDWAHDFSPWVSSAMDAAKETKFGTNWMRMMPELLFSKANASVSSAGNKLGEWLSMRFFSVG